MQQLSKAFYWVGHAVLVSSMTALFPITLAWGAFVLRTMKGSGALGVLLLPGMIFASPFYAFGAWCERNP